MGLAPYGEPRYATRIMDNLIDVKEDGSFSLDMGVFDYWTGLTMTNELFLVPAVLSRSFEITGCPVIVNTSFNIRGEPIVCTPEDAFRCFMGADIELLVIGGCMVRKADQDLSRQVDYRPMHELA